MNKYVIYVFLIVLILTTSLYGHIDNYLLPEDCGSCHTGHGLKNEPMLNHSEEKLCYQCHSDESKRSQMKTSGRLAEEAVLANIETEFNKTYRHPVKSGTGHKPGEKLDNMSAASINHSECVDCHNPHTRTNATNKHEVSGISLSGNYLETATEEFEVCFKCHANTKSLKSYSKNIRRSFALSNRSQHPVTKDISTIKSVSLNMASNFSSAMKCSDCHTNDNKNGPKGPHGSRHKYLLSGNYDTDIYNTESSYAYEFCYSCHDRLSILSNNSFPLHKEHVVGDPLKNIKGTSCFTCHSSHSSETYEHLIGFNQEAVGADDNTKKISYQSNGTNSGECTLLCHGYSHTSAKY